MVLKPIFGCEWLVEFICKQCDELKEEFRKMQSRLMWLIIVLFAVGIMSIGIVGCGGDSEEEGSADKATESSSTASTGDQPAVAQRPPIDFAAEKAGIQKVYSAFYKAFNDNDIKAIGETFDTGNIQFGTIFAGDEPVPVATGWNNVKIGIEGLWIGIGTKGAKWGPNDQVSKFWIRYKGSKLEASALGLNCYKGAFPGETHLYLVQDKKGGWLIQQIDGITQNNLPKFGLEKLQGKSGQKPRIEKFFFKDEDLAP